VLEVPVEITGHRRLNYRATTSYFDTGHKTWVQLQRAAEPNLTTFFDFANGLAHVDHNASVPPDDRVLVAGSPPGWITCRRIAVPDGSRGSWP
jgi:hypothetical protein